MQTTQRGNSKGVLKIQLSIIEEKIDVLRHKSNLKNSSTFSNVYIRSSKTHSERLIDLNFKTLINDLIPKAATGYRITGSGKLIKKISNDHTQPNVRTQMEDNIQLPQKSHGLPTMQAAQPTATVCNPVLPPAAAIQQIQVQPGNGPIRTPQTSNPFLPTSSLANMSRSNLSSDVNTQRNSANFPQLSQPEVMTTVNTLNHSITRPHTQMNFHDGSKRWVFCQHTK